MSKSASTNEKTEIIKFLLKSSNLKAEMFAEYDDSGTWRVIEDLDSRRGIDISKSAKKFKYANFNLTPLASTIKFNILNKDGRYSEGSGSTLAGLFDLDTKVRVRGGYKLIDANYINPTDIYNVNLNDSAAFKHFTKHNVGNYIELDKTNASADTNIYFTNFLNSFDELNIFDRTGNHTITLVDDAKLSNDQSKYGTTSGKTDGVDDHFSIVNSSDFDFAAGDFTLEFWWYAIDTNSGSLVEKRAQGDPKWIDVHYSTGTDKVQLFIDDNGSWGVANGVDLISSVTYGQWYHIAVTRSGNVWRSFVDGIEVWSVTDNTTLTFDAGEPLELLKGDAGNEIAAYINGFRLTKGAARYTSNFTPPPDPLTQIDSNDKLIINFDAVPAYFLTTYNLWTSTVGKKVNTIDVTTNNTKGTIFYRLFTNQVITELDEQVSDGWVNAGATVNGTKNITVNKENHFIQIAILYDDYLFADDLRVTGIDINYEELIEWIYYDIFYLDSPSFTDPKEPSFAMVNCKGRDIWKRAVETELNLQDLTTYSTLGTTNLDVLIKGIADEIGIEYTASSIADLSGFSGRTLSIGYEETVKAEKIFEDIMQILNQSGNVYQMYVEYDSGLDANILFVQPIPSLYQTDFVFNYQHYESAAQVRKNYDKLLQRITVLTDEQVLAAEVQLTTATYITVGNKTLSWSGDAEFKRFTVTLNSGSDAIVTLVETNTTNMVFNVAADSTLTNINVTITIWGNKWDSTNPTYEGEAFDYDNHIAGKGTTSKFINPLVISDVEAREIAEGFEALFGTPDKEARGLKYPYMNLLLEQNDMTLFWARFAFVDDLYFITGIKLHWDLLTDNSNFNLNDSGLNFSDEGDFIYDREDPPVSGTAIRYDIGFLYDMRFGVHATDAEIDTGTTLVHNVSFT